MGDPFSVYPPLEFMATVLFLAVGGGGLVFLPGSIKSNAFGETIDDVSMKNMNNKNIMSVKDDILKLGFTVLRFLTAMNYPFMGCVAMIAFILSPLAIEISL